MHRTMVLVALGVISGSAAADVRLPAIFGDNMVLQRGVKRQIWGWADPGEEVTVTFGNFQISTKTNDQGRWITLIDPVEAEGPTTLTVSGKNTIVLQNVVVGEVWLCSGQSNMEWPVSRSADAEQEISAADYPEIRLFTVERATAAEPANDVRGKWVVCSPETVAEFSAVGYFFGREIHRKVGTPVGLIDSTWGGTRAEAWTERNALLAVPALAEQVPVWDAEESPQHRTAHLYNAMIHPIMDFAKRGVIWYQGESNADRASEYRVLFRTLIKSWRPPFAPMPPFYFVQLANFKQAVSEPGESEWAELREAQAAALLLEATAMAVTIDIGDANDIHPRNKQEVGRRLALHALRNVHGRTDIVASGPLFKSARFAGSEVTITFDSVGTGLIARGGELKGFAIAGHDRRFVWADARIEGDHVIVSSPEVPRPVAVRYGWADNPQCNLFNSEGLPAAPFRTDKWPGITTGRGAG